MAEYHMKRAARKVVATWAIWCAAVVGPLWWWAVRGMSPDIGTAWAFTDFLGLCVATAVTIVAGVTALPPRSPSSRA